jgi:predicted Zn-ribbon and HTH transcriptional regulator
MGRPPTLRFKVQKVMQETHTPLSITDICRLIGVEHKNHTNSVRRALLAIEAKIVSIHRPRPIPNRRGGCKPVNLWSL